jgi:hypothetical protein
VANSAGKSLTFDISEDAKTSYELTFPSANATGSLTNDGSGILSWQVASSLTAANGTAAAPSFTFTGDLDTGVYLAAANTLGLATGGVATFTLARSSLVRKYLDENDSTDFIAYREVFNNGIFYIQTSAESATPVGGFTTIRVTPYLSTTNVFEIQRNLVTLGTSGVGNDVGLTLANGSVNITSGTISIAGNQVLISRQSAIASASTVTTVGSNTGTAGAGLSLIGDTSTVDQSAPIMNDLRALQEDISNVQSQLNLALAALRTHGLIAT